MQPSRPESTGVLGGRRVSNTVAQGSAANRGERLDDEGTRNPHAAGLDRRQRYPLQRPVAQQISRLTRATRSVRGSSWILSVPLTAHNHYVKPHMTGKSGYSMDFAVR